MTSSNTQDLIDEVDVCQRGTLIRKLIVQAMRALICASSQLFDAAADSSAVQPDPILRSRANAAEQTT